MLLFLLFIPSFTLYCYQNNQTIYASTYDRKEWNLNRFFYSEDLTFSLNGNEENFDILPLLQPLEGTQINLINVTLIDVNSMKRGEFETNQMSILIKNESIY